MTKNLTEGDPARLIFFFALPLVAGNMMQQLYAFIDTLIVGRFLGVNALAAVGCTGSLMFLTLGFIMGFCTGVTIYTGQRFGAGDAQGVRRSAAACVVLGILAVLTLTAIILPLTRSLLLLMETPAEIIDGAQDFISIVFAGLTIFLVLYLQNCLIRSLGDSTTPTIFLAVTLAINVALEPVAILVLGWGIPGAALATVFSQAIGAVLFFVYIWRRVPALHTRWTDWKPDRVVLMAHLRMGLPMAFQASVIAFGAIILQVALNNLGAIPVAAYAATQKIDAVAVMPMLSFGYALAAYTAQNYGAQKYERIRMGVRVRRGHRRAAHRIRLSCARPLRRRGRGRGRGGHCLRGDLPPRQRINLCYPCPPACLPQCPAGTRTECHTDDCGRNGAPHARSCSDLPLYVSRLFRRMPCESARMDRRCRSRCACIPLDGENTAPCGRIK